MSGKKIEKLFKSYRDQLLHLAKLYGIVEVKSYARSAKRLTISQLELLLIKNRIKLPINRSSDKAIAKEECQRLGGTEIEIIKSGKENAEIRRKKAEQEAEQLRIRNRLRQAPFGSCRLPF